MSDITQILHHVAAGEPDAPNRLYRLVYDELRQIAAAKMAGEFIGRTLQPTALVHEAWLRLGGDQQASWSNRAHFFGAAAEAMRRILIDRARRRSAARRVGSEVPIEINSIDVIDDRSPDERLLVLEELLEKLAATAPQKAELVKLRFYIGLTSEQAAATLGISEATAQRWWAYARAWIIAEAMQERCLR